MTRAEAIADAVHNLPMDLRNPRRIARFPHDYLKPLIERYPDLAELRDLLP